MTTSCGLLLRNSATSAGASHPPDEVAAVRSASLEQVPALSPVFRLYSTQNRASRPRVKEFRFLSFNPGSDKKTRRESTAQSRWKDNALALVRDTPRAEDWLNVLKEKGLYDSLRDENAVVSLLNAATGGHVTNEPVTIDSHPERLDRIRCYVQATAQRHIRAGVALTLANFQMFPVQSCCAVLLEIGHEPDDVFDVLRICIGRDASSKRCQDVLKACRYLHRLADTLYMHGWGLRAGEAILLCQ